MSKTLSLSAPEPREQPQKPKADRRAVRIAKSVSCEDGRICGPVLISFLAPLPPGPLRRNSESRNERHKAALKREYSTDVYAAWLFAGEPGRWLMHPYATPWAKAKLKLNPPFRLAEQFLRRSMMFVRPGGYVALLLRAGFLESKRRQNLLRQYPPLEVWFLTSRPKFTGPNSDGATTDTAMYAWFVWRKGERPDHFEGHLL